MPTHAPNSDASTPDDLLRHAEWLRRLARRLVRDESTADDLVQDTWAAALTARPDRSDLGTWLRRSVERLARHRSRSELRRRRREHVAGQERHLRSDAEVHEAFEAQRVLSGLVDELPEPYRTLVMRRYYDGCTATELARADGASPATVRSRLARARAMLRARWRETYEPDRSTRGVYGLGGLLLLAGATPEVVGTGTLMKANQVLLLTGALALALVGAWQGGWLSNPSREARATGESAAQLAPIELAEQTKGDIDAPSVDNTERAAIAPTHEDEASSHVTDPAPRTRLVMRVVDRDGQPVEGATLLSPSWPEFGKGKSDARGHLELETEPTNIQIWRGQPAPRDFRLAADGFATHDFSAAMTRDAETDVGDVVLLPGGAIEGRVRDERGQGVGGATVVVTDLALGTSPEAARNSGPIDADAPRRVETQPDGSYRVDGLSVESLRVWAHVEGRLWAFTPPVPVQARTTVRADDLTLAPPDRNLVIAGRVVGASGVPVARAVVLASGLSEGLIRTRKSTADDDGKFELLAFDQGPHRLAAYHPEAEQTPASIARVLPGTHDVELRLTPLRLCTVTLLDDRTGDPVEDPWLHVDDASSMPHAEGAPRREHEDVGPGSLRVPLPTASFWFGASARRHEHGRFGPYEPASMPDELTLRLRRKPMISGRVIAEGKPVEGARVRTTRSIEETFSIETEGFRTRLFDGGMRGTTTDADGHFEHPASNAMPNGAHVLHASKDGWASTELAVEVDEDGASDVELELTRGGTLEGAVLLPSDVDPRSGIVAASNGDGTVHRTRVDQNGVYRFEHVAAGPWEVDYRDEEAAYFGSMSTTPQDEPYAGDCVVVAGETTRHDLDMRATTQEITGHLSIDGAPCAGWTVRLEEKGSPYVHDSSASVSLDASGAYSIENGFDSASLVFESPANAARYVRVTRAIAAREDVVDATLHVTTGRLEGQAPAGARLRLLASPGDDWSFRMDVEADANGTFEAQVPLGDVRVEIEKVEAERFTRFVPAGQTQVREGVAANVDAR